MVFFSSCNSVKYHGELLNYIDVPVKDIHGKQKQQRRTSTFLDFCKACQGSLTVMNFTSLVPVKPGQLSSMSCTSKVSESNVRMQQAFLST